jgi:hypothetical protein
MTTDAKKVGASGRSPDTDRWREEISAFISRRPVFTTDELYAALSDAPDFDDICGRLRSRKHRAHVWVRARFEGVVAFATSSAD